MNPGHLRVLLVDDDEDVYVLIRDAFRDVDGLVVDLEWVETYEGALDRLAGDPLDACLLDYRLDEQTGLDLLREAGRRGHRTPVIMLTGQGDYEIDVEAMRAGAADYLIKDRIDGYTLERSIRYAIERRRSSQLLAQAAKMAALGELSGNIAHEVNNPIAIINAKARLLLSDDNLDLDPKVERDLTRIVEQCNRIQVLTRGLTDFARPSQGARAEVDVNEALQKALGLATGGNGVVVTANLDPDLPPILANSNELQQVFLNLLINGIDAIKDGGALTVTSRPGSSSRAVEVVIEDTGAGISEDVRKRIFEPFFTTKPAVKGTGLGLAICLGIVSAHRGEILVSSTPEEGTQFTVRLPTAGG